MTRRFPPRVSDQSIGAASMRPAAAALWLAMRLQAVERIRGLRLLGRQHMRVRVEGDPDRGVPEPLRRMRLSALELEESRCSPGIHHSGRPEPPELRPIANGENYS
jgi:hypothetical protein